MDRRNFLKSVAASTAALHSLAAHAESGNTAALSQGASQSTEPAASVSVEGHTLLCRFSRGKEAWTVYEDLRTRDGNLTFVSSAGTARVLRKTAEATFADDGPPHLGLDIKDIGMSGPDLLADKLLAKGDRLVADGGGVRGADAGQCHRCDGDRGQSPDRAEHDGMKQHLGKS